LNIDNVGAAQHVKCIQPWLVRNNLKGGCCQQQQQQQPKKKKKKKKKKKNTAT
jgi:hypothetical protein